MGRLRRVLGWSVAVVVAVVAAAVRGLLVDLLLGGEEGE
jgi:hypothetical protein